MGLATLAARTSSAEQTRALASALGAVVAAGDLVLLTGELAAGKTTFAQGMGRGLGVEEPITSPTFTLHRRYQGRLEFNHIDVYRIDQIDEVADLGLPELLDGPAVTLIEWGEVVAPVIPPDFLEVRIGLGEGDDDRTFELAVVGHRWGARARVLREALAPWAGDEGDGPC
ncbi:MAG: tRNA (adenosine(37)-N6)-threonylcarbamoyltransferase complex ATPase subunit type 1 TsaE [Acidimicrobiia bacterium]|nr:tRNA (adenosine(37)-N6)-threonylcarbamoyltransferase complex ATPase subunit type 1 TsaE [Acidimicrobiia bacterium]